MATLAKNQGKYPTSYLDISTPLMPKHDNPLPKDHRGLSLFSALYGVETGAIWRHSTPWMEQWIHPPFWDPCFLDTLIAISYERRAKLQSHRLWGTRTELCARAPPRRVLEQIVGD